MLPPGGFQAAFIRVQEALARLLREKTAINVAAVSRRAQVSRTFCYDKPEARAVIAAAMAEAGKHRRQLIVEQGDEQEASWRERALNVEVGLKAAHAKILTQRARIGELLGQIRDLEAEWTGESIQRITTENTTLKQRIRQLTADNRALEERLAAARSNLRFADRRVADLEATVTRPGALREGGPAETDDLTTNGGCCGPATGITVRCHFCAPDMRGIRRCGAVRMSTM